MIDELIRRIETGRDGINTTVIGDDFEDDVRTTMKDYDALPMLMNEEQIAAATRELLDEARAEPRPNPRAVAEALVGMISRQSGLYKPFAPELAADIEAWVDAAWATEPLALFDALATVAVNLGSSRMRLRLAGAADHHDPQVRRIAEDALAEM